MRLILFYTSGWGEPNPGWYYVPFLLLGSLLTLVGFGVGAVRRFPRWAYLYAFALPAALATLVTSTAYLYGVLNYAPYSIFLFLAIVLAILWLPGLRAFYHQIGQDWTLLSYGLYVVVLIFLGGIDKDESPRLNAQVLLPPLISLIGALAHLRIRDAFARMVALLAACWQECCWRPCSLTGRWGSGEKNGWNVENFAAVSNRHRSYSHKAP